MLQYVAVRPMLQNDNKWAEHMCCSVLQCAEVCFSVLRYVAVRPLLQNDTNDEIKQCAQW